MKKDVEEIIRERIEENKELFTEEEITFINHNFNIIMKVFIIGILDNV